MHFWWCMHMQGKLNQVGHSFDAYQRVLKQSGIDQWAPHCPSLSETHTRSHYYSHHTNMKQMHTHTTPPHKHDTYKTSLFIKIYIVKSASSSVHSIQRWSHCWRVEMEGQVHLKMTQQRVSYTKTKEKVDRTVCYHEHFLFDARLFTVSSSLWVWAPSFSHTALRPTHWQHSTPPYPLTTQHSALPTDNTALCPTHWQHSTALPTAKSPTRGAKQNVAVRRRRQTKRGWEKTVPNKIWLRRSGPSGPGLWSLQTMYTSQQNTGPLASNTDRSTHPTTWLFEQGVQHWPLHTLHHKAVWTEGVQHWPLHTPHHKAVWTEGVQHWPLHTPHHKAVWTEGVQHWPLHTPPATRLFEQRVSNTDHSTHPTTRLFEQRVSNTDHSTHPTTRLFEQRVSTLTTPHTPCTRLFEQRVSNTALHTPCHKAVWTEGVQHWPLHIHPATRLFEPRSNQKQQGCLTRAQAAVTPQQWE